MAASEKKKLLEVRGLTMDFGGLRAIDNVGLDIHAGEIVALIGPNGAGKTTFFNCVTGIYTPTSGDVLIHPPHGQTRRINGMKPNSITELGMARTFQNIRLFPAMTVLENVMMPALIAGTKRKPAETRGRDLLDLLGLSDKAKAAPMTLSGGQRQRLAIARALANTPTVLLADEPTGALDSDGGEEILELFRRLHRDSGQTILLITHDQPVADAAGRIARMRDGRVVDDGHTEPDGLVVADADVV